MSSSVKRRSPSALVVAFRTALRATVSKTSARCALLSAGPLPPALRPRGRSAGGRGPAESRAQRADVFDTVALSAVLNATTKADGERLLTDDDIGTSAQLLTEQNFSEPLSIA